MIELKGRSITKTVDEGRGLTLMELALRHKIDWSFSCERGTCARCRCLVAEGAELLEPPTKEERTRLEPEEIEQGYRLGCQARIAGVGNLKAALKTYF